MFEYHIFDITVVDEKGSVYWHTVTTESEDVEGAIKKYLMDADGISGRHTLIVH